MNCKQPSVLLLSLLLSLHLFLPQTARCSKSCHVSRSRMSNPPACHKHKSEAPSGFEIKARCGCDCSVRSSPPSGKEEKFALNPSSNKIAKVSVAPSNSLNETVLPFLATSLHGPPQSLALTGQDIFLVNSNLRI